MNVEPPSQPGQPSIRRQLWRAKKENRARLRMALIFGLLFFFLVIWAAIAGWISPAPRPPAGVSGGRDTNTPVEPESSMAFLDDVGWAHTFTNATSSLRGVVPGEAAEVEFSLEYQGNKAVRECVVFVFGGSLAEVRSLMNDRLSILQAPGRPVPWTSGPAWIQASWQGWTCLLVPGSRKEKTFVRVRHALSEP